MPKDDCRAQPCSRVAVVLGSPLPSSVFCAHEAITNGRKRGNEPRGGKHAGVGPSNDAASIPQVRSAVVYPPHAPRGRLRHGGSVGSNNKRLQVPPGFRRPS